MAKARALSRNLTPTGAELTASQRSPQLAPEPTTERSAALRAFTPKNGHCLSEAAQIVLIDLVLTTPFKTTNRDLDLLGAITDLAAYEYKISRTFDPAKLFTERTMSRWSREWLSTRGISVRSQGDYASLVRAVAKAAGLAPHLTDRRTAPRGHAKRPAEKQAWGKVLTEASRLPEALRVDVTILADLTFGIGMRSDEVGRACIDDLYLLPHNEGRMRVINKHGVIRDVPVGPAVTQRILSAKREPGQLLFRPGKARKDLIHRFFRHVDKYASTATFDPLAARNYFVVNLLSQPIPVGVVAYLADLTPGGHTIQDLAKYVSIPKAQDILDYARGSWR